MIEEEFSLDLFHMTPQEIRGHLPDEIFSAATK
jgi:hypothetical protein